MTSDALAAERARFWISALYYYRSLRWGRAHPYYVDAWEQAKEDLLAAVECERERQKRRLAPLPASFTGECPACGEKQEGSEVCADCVALYGSAAAALIAAQGRKRTVSQALPKHIAVMPLTQLVGEEAIVARRELCARMRDLLARHGRIHLGAAATMLGVCWHTARAVLRDVEAGSDGQPPVNVKKTRDGRAVYWEVSE